MKKAPQFLWTLGPDHKDEVYVTEPAEDHIGYPVKCHLNILQEESGNHQRKW
jgi:hypothetical protein